MKGKNTLASIGLATTLNAKLILSSHSDSDSQHRITLRFGPEMPSVHLRFDRTAISLFHKIENADRTDVGGLPL